MADIIEQRITPDKPRIIDHQEVKVYTPVARSGKKGIASYNPEDFLIDNKGMVSARNSLKTQRQFADPIHDPDKMGNINEPGLENENSVSLAKLLDIEFQHVENGEYGFDPRSTKGVAKLNRRQLSTESFGAPSLVMINEDDFLQITMPITNFTRSYIKWPTYPFNDAPGNVVADTERKLGFSMDARYFSLIHPDSKTVKTFLPRASEFSETLEAESGFGAIRIDQRSGGQNPWLQFVTRLPANNDPLSTDGLMDLAFREDSLRSYLQTELDFSRIVPNYSADATFGALDGKIVNDPKDPNFSRKLAYIANFVQPGKTVTSAIDGLEYTNGVQLPFGEVYDPNTMFQRTLLLLDKEGIGLGRIPNLDPLSWVVSNPVREILEQLQGGTTFAKKKDDAEFISDVGLVYEQSVNPTTVKQRIANLEFAVQGMTSVSVGFLGYITIPDEEDPETYLNDQYPVTTPGFGDLTNLFVTNTNTLWGWTSTGWVDTEVNLIRGDEFQYKLGGILKTLTVLSQDELSGLDDFKMEFNNSLLDLKINIPYVAESKYFHNWKGQLPNGVEDFSRGTTINGAYKKLWIGTKEEYELEFTSPPDESIVTMITDDTTNFEGIVVDDTYLETRLNQYTNVIMAGTQVGKRYVIKPVVGGIGQAPGLQGWGIEEYVPERFVQVIVAPGITNIIGAGDDETGILRYNGQNFALLTPGLNEGMDPLLGIGYKGIHETVEDNLINIPVGRIGIRAGAYITLPDLQHNFGISTNNKPLLNHMIDTSYQVTNYPNWVEGTPGAVSSTATLQNSINKMWGAILNIDTTNGEQDLTIEGMTSKLNKYPDPNISAGGGGNFVLTIPTMGTPTSMSLTNLASVIGENPLSELVNLNQWTHGTGQNTVGPAAMTSVNFANMFASASQVKYISGADGSINNILFWIGTKAQYAAIGSKDASRLYICVDGALYFGTQLIAEKTITTGTVVSEMTAVQVQTLLNKLGQV